MTVQGVASISFRVRDWERAKRFYEEVLGLRCVSCDNDQGWAAYTAGSSSVPLFLIRDPGSAASTGATIGFFAEDASRLIDKVTAAGGAIVAPVQNGVDVRIFTTSDPDGNVFEISERSDDSERPT